MPSYDEDDEVDIPDRVLVRLIPRKSSKWIYATIGAEFVGNLLEIAGEAMDGVITALCQRYNYEQERIEMFETVGREIEALDNVGEVLGASTE